MIGNSAYADLCVYGQMITLPIIYPPHILGGQGKELVNANSSLSQPHPILICTYYFIIFISHMFG